MVTEGGGATEKGSGRRGMTELGGISQGMSKSTEIGLGPDERPADRTEGRLWRRGWLRADVSPWAFRSASVGGTWPWKLGGRSKKIHTPS